MEKKRRYTVPKGAQCKTKGVPIDNPYPGHWYCPNCQEFIDVREIDLRNVSIDEPIELRSSAICAYCGARATTIMPPLLDDWVASPGVCSHLYVFDVNGVTRSEAHRRSIDTKIWDVLWHGISSGIIYTVARGVCITRVFKRFHDKPGFYRVVSCA